MQERNFLITLLADYFQERKFNKTPKREPTPEAATEPARGPATEPTRYDKLKLKLQQ